MDYFAEHGVEGGEAAAGSGRPETMHERMMRLLMERARALGVRVDADTADAAADRTLDFGPELTEEQIAQFAATTVHLGGREGPPPASRSFLAALPEIVVTRAGKGCSVCLEEFEVDERVVRLPCRHLFHRDCVTQWLRKHCTCPMCRHVLPTDDPDYEDDVAFKRIQERMEKEERGRDEAHSHADLMYM